MCPACLANAGILVAGAVSTGGVSALVAKVLHKKTKPEMGNSKAKEK
jgi:hypothetical protein